MYQRTVLIVEDEILIRMLLADTLLDEGHDVIEAGNVLEAVAILGQRKIDAVVTDVDMPGEPQRLRSRSDDFRYSHGCSSHHRIRETPPKGRRVAGRRRLRRQAV